jgi:hypothetical protein
MPVESVTTIADLNPAWPLGSDSKDAGDNHLRNIKVAVVSLVNTAEGLKTLGFATVEMLLTAAITEITYSGPVVRGGIVTVILRQDATGGRQITWGAIFKGAPSEISPYAGTYNVYMFVGAAAGDLVLCSRPMLDVSI